LEWFPGSGWEDRTPAAGLGPVWDLTVVDGELWTGHGGVPFGAARHDGISKVKVHDGDGFEPRGQRGSLGIGVVALAAIEERVICDAGTRPGLLPARGLRSGGEHERRLLRADLVAPRRLRVRSAGERARRRPHRA
jgi:hypothetical protein